jgi:hypothetical protein
MANMGFKTWRCGDKGPSTLDDLREALLSLARKKKGRKLLSDEFVRTHRSAGLLGDAAGLAAAVGEGWGMDGDSILLSPVDVTAQKEVINWVDRVPDKALTYKAGIWTVSPNGGLVKTLKGYVFGTLDTDALNGLKPEDIVRKNSKWLEEEVRKPRIACRFAKDGTPVIHRMVI